MKPPSPWKPRTRPGAAPLPSEVVQEKGVRRWILVLLVCGVIAPPLIIFVTYRDLEARGPDAVQEVIETIFAVPDTTEEARRQASERTRLSGPGEFLHDLETAFKEWESTPLVRLQTSWEEDLFRNIAEKGLEKLTFFFVKERDGIQYHRVVEEGGTVLGTILLAWHDGRWHVVGMDPPSPPDPAPPVLPPPAASEAVSE